METFDNKDNFIAAVEEAKQRLAAGETPKNVFDVCFPFDEGLAEVKLNSKWNYINRNGDILSDVWFDRCYDFYDGFACVVVNGKGNYIDCNGKLISDTWFDDCGFFYDGFAAVRLNDKWNYIDHEGKYLSDMWFDDCGNFIKGFAYAKLNGIRYLLRKDGVLCDWNTKEPIEPHHSVSPETDYKKKYEEALERAKFLKENTDGVGAKDVSRCFEEIFPELKESEDDRIKTNIIKLLRFIRDTYHQYHDECNEAIAWIEKRVKQNWSEEDEQRIEDIIATLMGCVTRLSNYGNLVTGDIIASLKDDIDWLKSIKERMK